MKLSNAFVAALALILVACANHSSGGQVEANSAPQGAKGPEDVSTLALPDALAAKYDAVTLNCNLWTRMTGPLVVTYTPDDTVSIDLIKDSSVPKTINLASKSDIHSLNTLIRVTDVKLQNGGHSDNYGAQYSFKNSPTIYGEYSGQSSTMYPQGYVGGTFQGAGLIINENIVSPIVAQSDGMQGEPSPTVDYVECSVITKVKPAYEDEWKQDSPGNEPSCLLGQPANPSDCMIRRN